LPDADNIEFECQECNAKISVSSEKSGQRVICPECVRTVVVPENSVAVTLFEDLFDEETSELKLSPINTEDFNNLTPPPVPEPSSEDAPEVLTPSGENGLELDDENEAGESLSDVVNEALGKLPTEEESDPSAPLKIEGLEGLYGGYSAHSITCRICDSLIHIEAEKIGTTIECPECFTKISIDPPTKRKLQKPIWQQTATAQTSDHTTGNSDDDELKLSDPIEKPKIDIDPSFGLDGPSEDLLTPKKPSAAEQLSDELSLAVESGQPTPSIVPSKKPVVSPKKPTAEQKNKSELPPIKTGRDLSPQSRRERLEKARQKQRSAEQGTVFSHRENSADMDSLDFPSTDLGTQVKSALSTLIAGNTVWRFAIAVLLMCTGAVVMESISPSYVSPESKPELTAAEQFFNFVTWLLLGGVPYLIGWLMLVYTSAYIFRDTALGYRAVNSWKNKGFNELTSTILVFGFSFVAAGILMLFLPLLKLPMQLLLAPLFLTSVWYSRSPFNIVNIDAFQTNAEIMQLWKSFYQLIAILVIAAIFSGLLLFIPKIGIMPQFLNLALTIVGVFLNGLITTLFAATCGWHCGRVSAEPRNN